MSDERRTQIQTALTKLQDVARAEELMVTARALGEVLKVLGYEAAGFRLPHCSRCRAPVPRAATVQAINRDRA